MVYQFKIPADAAELRRAADLVEGLGESFRINGPKISGTPEVFAGDKWSGQTRDQVCAELEGLGARMSKLPNPLRRVSAQLRSAAGVIDRVAYDVFQLNKAYEIAEAKEYTSGNKRSSSLRWAKDDAERAQIEQVYIDDREDAQSTMRGLTAQFADKRIEVQQALIEVGRVLGEETIVTVPESVIAAFRAGGGNGAALWRYPPPVGILPEDLGVDDIFGRTQPMLAARTTMADAEIAAHLTEAAAAGDATATAKLHEISNKYPKNPLFSAHYAKTLGVEGYAQAGRVLTDRFAATTPDSAAERQVSADNEWLAAFLGGTINDAADTRNDNKLTRQQQTDIKTWRDKVFLPELKTMGRTEYSIENGNHGFHGYWLLGQLVHAGAKNGQPPGPDFMQSVGADAIQWDADNNDPENPQDLDWASPFGPFISGSEAHRSGFTISKTRDSADPIHEILSAASYDRQAAQALFTGEVISEHGSVNRLDYLMKERRQPSHGGTAYDDKGAALGTAVRAADMDRMDKTGTEIASRFVNNYMTGLKEGEFKLAGVSNQNHFGNSMGGLRPYLGDVMAHYIDDVGHTIYHVKKPGFDAYAEGQPLEYNLQINDATKIPKLIADLAADRPEHIANLDADPPNALQKILIAQLQLTQNRLIPLANDTHRMSVEGEKLGRILGYIRRSGEIGLEAQGKEKDEVNKLLQGIGKQGIDLIPPVKAIKGNPIGAVVTGPIIDKSLNKMFPVDNLSKYQKEIPADEREIDTLYNRAIQEAMRERTDWAKGTSPQEWLAGPGQQYGAEGKFTDDEGKIIARKDRTGAQEEAFEEWWSGESNYVGENSDSSSMASVANEINNGAGRGLDMGLRLADRDSRG